MRLIHAGQVKDTHTVLQYVADFPAQLTFFDRQNAVGLMHLAPIFGAVGFCIEMLALDAMHILDLGVSQFLVAAVLMHLLQANFAKSTASTALL
eukprot:7003845-Pyramimonas_sp.AAC.1